MNISSDFRQYSEVFYQVLDIILISSKPFFISKLLLKVLEEK